MKKIMAIHLSRRAGTYSSEGVTGGKQAKRTLRSTVENRHLPVMLPLRRGGVLGVTRICACVLCVRLVICHTAVIAHGRREEMRRKRRSPASLDGSTAQVLPIELKSLFYQKLRLTRFYTFTIEDSIISRWISTSVWVRREFHQKRPTPAESIVDSTGVIYHWNFDL
ncbi:unnamed protein product, partial [Nesidiocoris tenuis]